MRLGMRKSSPLLRIASIAPITSSVLIVGLVLGTARTARADDSCKLQGEVVVPRTVSMYDAPTGGQEIAHFTGGKVGIAITTFPDTSGGRAVVETTGFRVKGFVRARDLPVYTTRSVPVYAGHVWIGDGQKVSVVGASPGKLRVEKSMTWPVAGIYQGWAPCDALTLSERIPSGWTPPGGARGWVGKGDHVDLYSGPRGDVVTGLDRAGDGPGILLWGTEREGAWIHVEHHGDVTIDAWARAQDLAPLPPGETMDQLAPARSVAGTPKIQVQGQSKVVRVAAPVVLRTAASDAAGVLGGIDAGVEVLVLDVVAGWASVIPKNLALSPAGSNQFWVKGKDLGL